jgi:tRNA modification GTPase
MRNGIAVDTIFAESTPRGRGGISIVRISGARTIDIIKKITPLSCFEPHKQVLSLVRDPSGAVIDQVMVVFHPKPHSYTGDDLTEISCHGNPFIVDKILDTIRQTGLARMAEKGEFSKRAFLNDKMDLVQAEAVGALVGTSSLKGFEMVQAMLQGELSGRITSLYERAAALSADLEASFITEEDELIESTILEMIQELISEIEDLLRDAKGASILHKGVITTIAGLPNVGKSSLFNAILGYPRAIVHHEEGTTRDVLTERLSIGSIDFLFHDTAGIRDTSSGPEMIGVEKTIETLKKSDLVLYVVDAKEGLKPEEMQWLKLCERTILVMNKTDLHRGKPDEVPELKTILVSAKYSLGIDNLLELMGEVFPQDQKALLLDRHAHLLGQALVCLENCKETLAAGLTPDVLVMDLNNAILNMRQITGQAIDEDILERIFAGFCIGK